MVKSDNIAALAKALVAAQKEMGAAVKDAKNPYFKSNYADLSAVIDAAVPVLNKNGIAVLQLPTTVAYTEPDNGYAVSKQKAVLRTVLLHESGEFLGSDTDIVSAKQNDPQAYGSAISYARRYGLQAAVTLKAADDDGEGAMSRTGQIKVTTSTTNPVTGVISLDTKVQGEDVTLNIDPTAKKKVTFAKKTVVAKPAASTEDEI